MSAPVGDGRAARSRPARVVRVRSIGRNLHRRISHLAAGLDPSQVSLNPVAGAGFVCSGEPMVWKPFFLPSRVSRCLDMPGLGCARVCWRASRGPPRCSCMLALAAAVAPGHGQRRAAREPGLAAELPLLSAWGGGKMLVSLGRGGKQVWVFARWGVVRLSVPPRGRSLHRLFLLGRIKMVNS